MKNKVKIGVISKDWKSSWDGNDLNEVIKGIKNPQFFDMQTDSDDDVMICIEGNSEKLLIELMPLLNNSGFTDFIMWGEELYWDILHNDFVITQDDYPKVIYWDKGEGLEIINKLGE